MNLKKPTKITGIGSALVDVLINESDRFLADLGKIKGGMTLVDDTDIQKILARTAEKPNIVPGGAACNTILGISMLGGETAFIGRRGDDEYGRLFESHLEQCRVRPLLSISPAPTGKVLSIITPDAQRSMFTFLGASTELAPEMVTSELFENSAIAVIEGYLLFNRDLMMAALQAAKAARAAIALDLASFEVVNGARDILDDLVDQYVDILIANEDEALAYTGHADEDKAIDTLSAHAEYAVLKIGKNGSIVSHNGRITRIAPLSGMPATDTTGAGDLWAAGFLYGLAHGYSIEKAGLLGSACGYEVCQVIGAQIPAQGWDRIRSLM